MPTYKENPKTAGSGILACIPQTGRCPNGCRDCFFQSGRSYLEPLADHLPNMPSPALAARHVVRVNDGNDSNVDRELAIAATAQYPMRFFNTAIPHDLGGLPGPVVLTVNPGEDTDNGPATLLDPIPRNLMFVRFRANTWNLALANAVVDHYSRRDCPTVLTFMAYFQDRPVRRHRNVYAFRTRTTNSYWAITAAAWEEIMAHYRHNRWVYSCGKIEGEQGTTACRHCGNCLREYFATMERLDRGAAKEGPPQ